MSYCEIMLIIRGYRRRNVLQYQLQRMQVFASTFCMGGNKEGKEPQQLWPLYFDKYIDHSQPPISEEEIEAEYAKIASGYAVEIEKVKTSIPVSGITEDVVLRKAVDFVKENAVIK